MNLIKKTTLAVGLLVAAAGYAQTSTTTTAPASTATSSGLLGQRYVEAGFGVTDLRGVSDNLFDLGVAVNLPVASSVDVGAFYNYSWFDGPFSAHSNQVGVGGTYYVPLSGIKPFASVGVGYSWDRSGGFRDNRGFWAAAIGAEIPVGAVTFTPHISYTDDFEGGNADGYSYGVEASTWISARTGVYLSVGRIEGPGSSDAWTYGLGVRFKF